MYVMLNIIQVCFGDMCVSVCGCVFCVRQMDDDPSTPGRTDILISCRKMVTTPCLILMFNRISMKIILDSDERKAEDVYKYCKEKCKTHFGYSE